MTTKQPEKFPPRTTIGTDVDGNFNVRVVLSGEHDLHDYFGDPMHAHIPGTTCRKPETYLSLREATAMAREARASAFEEAAMWIRKHIDDCSPDDAAYEIESMAEAARKESK